MATAATLLSQKLRVPRMQAASVSVVSVHSVAELPSE